MAGGVHAEALGQMLSNFWCWSCKIQLCMVVEILPDSIQFRTVPDKRSSLGLEQSLSLSYDSEFSVTQSSQLEQS